MDKVKKKRNLKNSLIELSDFVKFKKFGHSV